MFVFILYVYSVLKIFNLIVAFTMNEKNYSCYSKYTVVVYKILEVPIEI